MVSPIKLNNNSDNAIKYKVLDEPVLKRLQAEMQPYLRDKHFLALKSLIQKYESFTVSEIEKILFSNINQFKAETQHKIRDFIRRRMRNERASGVEGNFVYQSDESNLVSPYSRDSFSSKSDTNLSPNALSNMKTEINKLWKYPAYQKEICQILWNNGDLEFFAENKIAINFENIRQSSLVALNEFISTKNKDLDNFLSNANMRILHDVLMDDSIMCDEKINDIYKIIKKRERISISESGKISIDIVSLKQETVNDLIRFLRPERKTDRSVNPQKRPAVVSKPTRNQMTPQPAAGSLVNSSQIKSQKTSSPQRFDDEQLRFLSSKIKEYMKDSRITDILEIIKTYDSLDEASINVKKMNCITIRKLFEYFNSQK